MNVEFGDLFLQELEDGILSNAYDTTDGLRLGNLLDETCLQYSILITHYPWFPYIIMLYCIIMSYYFISYHLIIYFDHYIIYTNG